VGGSLEPTYAESRQGDVRDSQADIGKAKELLGYEPIVSFEEGLARTIAWYRTASAAATA
jgi:nucleoside-diphosphate-sugar epimerase